MFRKFTVRSSIGDPKDDLYIHTDHMVYIRPHIVDENATWIGCSDGSVFAVQGKIEDLFWPDHGDRLGTSVPPRK